jgi:hypothetical protein
MLPADNSDSLIRKRVYAEPFSQQEADYLMTLVSGLSASAFRYQDVEEIITEEAEDYFSGGKSAAEVIRVIQNRCAIYLEEKK